MVVVGEHIDWLREMLAETGRSLTLNLKRQSG
jgi:hypothetical protein